MAERMTPITTDMFEPVEDRSAKTNLQLVFLMSEYLGRGRLRFCRIIESGGVLTDDMQEDIDRYALNALRRRHNLPRGIDPQEFYVQQQRHAIDVIDYYRGLLPDVDSLELKDEISLLSDRPSDLLRLIFKPSDAIDRVLAYEAPRHALLSDISGMTNARTANGRLRTRLSEMHHLLNDKFFKGPEGAGSKFVVQSLHDNETNTVVGFPQEGKRIPLTAHLKRISFIVRAIPDGALVYTSPRKKDDKVATIKAITKAQNNDGVIRIDDDVQDTIGMIFVAVDGRVTPEQLTDQVVSVIESDPRQKISKIEEINQTGADHGQASATSFNQRRRIWYENMAVPIELIFYDLETYLNSRLEVGVRDSKTGLYGGRAHRLFEVRRAAEPARVLFPEPVYPEDLEHAFVYRSQLDAQELRNMYRAA